MSDFPIPEPFVYDDSFKVFYDNLDDEHRSLFKAVFAVAADRSSKANFDNLLSVTKNHFKDEEGMMTKANYGGYTSHKAAHDDFVAVISSKSLPLQEADVNYAKSWLVNHIKGIDFKYKKQL